MWTDFTFALKARTLWCGSFCVCGPFVSKVQVLYIPKMYANGSITDSYSDIYATWDITDAIKVTIVD